MTSVLKLKVRSKRRVSLPVDPHGFESIGSILRRMRRECESRMTTEFSRPLSLRIDYLLDQEQRCEEDRP
jgi:hypothetical protein